MENTNKERLWSMYYPVHQRIEQMLEQHSPEHVFAVLCKEYGAKDARALLNFYSDIVISL